MYENLKTGDRLPAMYMLHHYLTSYLLQDWSYYYLIPVGSTGTRYLVPVHYSEDGYSSFRDRVRVHICVRRKEYQKFHIQCKHVQ